MLVVAEDIVTGIEYICSIEDTGNAKALINFFERIDSARFQFRYGEVIEESDNVMVQVNSTRNFVDVIMHIILTDSGIVI